MYCHCFEDGGSKTTVKNMAVISMEKGQDIDSSLESLERNVAPPTP